MRFLLQAFPINFRCLVFFWFDTSIPQPMDLYDFRSTGIIQLISTGMWNKMTTWNSMPPQVRINLSQDDVDPAFPQAETVGYVHETWMDCHLCHVTQRKVDEYKAPWIYKMWVVIPKKVLNAFLSGMLPPLRTVLENCMLLYMYILILYLISYVNWRYCICWEWKWESVTIIRI